MALVCVAANVLQIDVGGLSELPVSIPTKGHLKIQSLLARANKIREAAAIQPER